MLARSYRVNIAVVIEIRSLIKFAKELEENFSDGDGWNGQDQAQQAEKFSADQ